MARRRVVAPPCKLVRWFDHVASPLVDVFPNAEGEFVQVWSGPRDHPNRYVVLAYQRTPDGPVAISSLVLLEGGPWRAFDTTGARRTFYYAGETHDTRYEELLPSGRALIHDKRQGLTLREVWADGFDWDRRTPMGRPLGDRAVRDRQASGATYFVASYQQEWAGTELRAERLVCVAEYRGAQWIKITEID